MAKKYIQIKPNSGFGAEYEGRSFLVTAEDADSFSIKRGSVIVPKDMAIVCNDQRFNLEGSDVYATLVKNHSAIFKIVPDPWQRHGLDARIKVEAFDVDEDGQLLLSFGEEYDRELDDGRVEELWVVAHRCSLEVVAKVYDEGFFKKQFPNAFKEKEGVVNVAFVESITKQIFIMADQFVNPVNENVTAGFSIRHGNDYISSFAEFPTLEELKASKLYQRVQAGEFN